MKIKEVLLYMKRKTFDIPVTLRREWFLIELAHLTKKYGIEIIVLDKRINFMKEIKLRSQR